MTHNDFIFSRGGAFTQTKITKKAPSNIALIKYWGKKGFQLPANPSLSFTIPNCYTQTEMFVKERTNWNDKFEFSFLFEEKQNLIFTQKIQTFFDNIYQYCPYLSVYRFEIKSYNSFPHSSGIASSASSMAALALCIMDLEKGLNPQMSQEFYYKKASFLARIGSGSASRSIQNGYMLWGQHPDIQGSSDLYAQEYPYHINDIFKDYCDSVLIIESGQKKVSSTVGHSLMNGHPFAQARYQQAIKNITSLKNIFETGDLETFIKIVESEALTLHAMMATNIPYFILIKGGTLSAIEKIWEYRQQTSLPLSFTLDAGANLHALYPRDYKHKIETFITENLAPLCQDKQVIFSN